ncbi:MAG: hypothetical protein ISP41_08955 [Alphaproteobacteria bacterium]|jgi:hypothetical protein|nr:hypothetical protein [Alphaproteobacteria bacterium]
MSRLDSAIRRLMAQKNALEWAVDAVTGINGPVLELGLGNGRTYDHLREIATDRRIYVFERVVAAHPDCVPPDEHLFLGDFTQSLPRAIKQLGAVAAMAHLDIGTGVKSDSTRLAERIAPLVRDLLAPGALVVSDQEIADWSECRLETPPGIPEGRIHLYRPIVGSAL